jgi:hypothetical protein
MVKDTKQEDKFYRADKLLEEEVEKRLKVGRLLHLICTLCLKGPWGVVQLDEMWGSCRVCRFRHGSERKSFWLVLH